MAVKKIVWLDKASKVYDTEAEADLANVRYIIIERLEGAIDNRTIDLKSIECWGPDYIRPIAEYFNDLLAKAEARSKAYG